MNELNPKIIKLTTEINEKDHGSLGKLKEFTTSIIGKKSCVECGQITNPNTYKKQIDKDEYFISGICEKCQPLYFGGKYNGN